MSESLISARRVPPPKPSAETPSVEQLSQLLRKTEPGSNGKALPLLGANHGKVAGTLRRAVRYVGQKSGVRPTGLHPEAEEPMEGKCSALAKQLGQLLYIW